MKKRIRKQLSVLLAFAMVFSMTCNVYADELKDDPGVSDTTLSEGQTPSADETVPEEDVPGTEETVTDPEAQEPVSDDGIMPEEESGQIPEEPAGDDTPEGRLIERIKNASSGETIKLTEDVTLTKVLEIGGGKKITIDLSGNKISGTGSMITELYELINSDHNAEHRHELQNRFLISVSGNGTEVTLTDSKKTGSISYNDANSAASDSIVAVWEGAALTAKDITLTPYDGKIADIGCTSAMVVGGKAIMVVGNTSVVTNADAYYARPKTESKVILNDGLTINRSYIGVYAIGSGATVIANEGAKVKAKNAAIQNQGELNYFGTDITVNGGRFIGYGDDGNGIYHPGAGDLKINGGEFLGKTAIEISNGIANIIGGKTSISADGEMQDDWVTRFGYTYSGSTAGGCAVCYSPYADKPGVKSELNITGGEFAGKIGLRISKRDTATADNLKNDVRLSVTGGTFTAENYAVDKAAGFDAGILEKFVSGGRFNLSVGGFLADGYGTTIKDGYHEVIKLTSAYIRPDLTQGVVFKGQSLSEAGLKVILEDESGKVIDGTAVTGNLSFWNTDRDGTVSGGAVDTSASINALGSYYLAVKKAGVVNISQNGIDMTDYYTIVNATDISANHLLSYSVEQIKEQDSLTIIQKKEVCYSQAIGSAYDFFEIYFTYNGKKQELGKTSGVKFYWDGALTPADSFDCSAMSAGTSIPVSIEYLGKTAGTSFTIQRFPIYVEGAAVVTSLVGDELAERYYGLINVYSAGEDRSTKTGTLVPGGDRAAMGAWFDCTSSVIDLSGITNARKGSYTALLKDAGRLTDVGDISKNYELIEKAYITYNVEPSLIIDFLEPSRETELAPTKIRRVDDSTDLLIYSFANKQSTQNATWCVKTVSYDSVEQCWKEEMADASTIGIIGTPIANNLGTKFSFTKEFLSGIAENGGRYTLYEVFTEDMEYKDEGNLSLTVKAVPPVVFNGNKFVAKDDSRYYTKGIPKNGFSPVLDISVWDGKNKLYIGTDYTLSYMNNKNAGNKDSDKVPTVTVTGKGIYSAMKINVPITILAADLSRTANVAVATQYVKYNGKELKPNLKVTYRSGANAGKEIPASSYDVTILDPEGKDVTAKKFKKSAPFSIYTAVITANGSNPNITGTISQVVKKTENDGTEEKEDIFFYGIPKSASKLTVRGTLAKVAYPLPESSGGIAAFIDRDIFVAKTPERKFFFDDIEKGSLSIDLVDGKDECTQTVFDPNDAEALNSGVYYLKTQLATDELKAKYYAFEPTYTKVTYAGLKLNTNDVKLKKKNFDFSSGDEYTALDLKLSNRLINKGTDGIKLYIYQKGDYVTLSDLAEEGYHIPGSELENNKAGRYRIRVEGGGAYYGSYDMTYTIGVQAYNKDTTPVAAFVNTASDDPSDETERAVHYRPDGDYSDELVKVVWTKSDEDNTKIVLKPRSVSGDTVIPGDYYVVWGTFKQVGPNKGSVTIVGTGTYFTGKFKKKFDVDQAE